MHRGFRPRTADTVRRKPNDASGASQLRSINGGSGGGVGGAPLGGGATPVYRA
jgi:hypothetical protein